MEEDLPQPDAQEPQHNEEAAAPRGLENAPEAAYEPAAEPAYEPAAEAAPEPQPIVVSKYMGKSLKTIAQWAQFFGILGFVGAGLMVLVGLGLTVVSMGFNLSYYGSINGLVGLLYLVIAGLYIYPSNQLVLHAKASKAAMAQNSQVKMEEAMAKLASAFNFMGILTAVLLAIYVLIIVVAAGAAIFGSWF